MKKVINYEKMINLNSVYVSKENNGWSKEKDIMNVWLLKCYL